MFEDFFTVLATQMDQLPFLKSDIIRSNQISLIVQKSKQKLTVNVIIRLLLSILCWPKVILLIGRQCMIQHQETQLQTESVSNLMYKLFKGQILYLPSDFSFWH